MSNIRVLEKEQLQHLKEYVLKFILGPVPPPPTISHAIQPRLPYMVGGKPLDEQDRE